MFQVVPVWLLLVTGVGLPFLATLIVAAADGLSASEARRELSGMVGFTVFFGLLAVMASLVVTAFVGIFVELGNTGYGWVAYWSFTAIWVAMLSLLVGKQISRARAQVDD